MKRTRRKLNVRKLVTFFVVVLVIILLIIGASKLLSKSSGISLKKSVDKYLASNINVVDLYDYVSATEGEEEKKLEKVDEIVRGSKISTKGDTINVEDTEYTLIASGEENYYVLSSSLVDNEEDVVLEKSKYVRTSVTVYKNETDSKHSQPYLSAQVSLLRAYSGAGRGRFVFPLSAVIAVDRRTKFFCGFLRCQLVTIEI